MIRLFMVSSSAFKSRSKLLIPDDTFEGAARYRHTADFMTKIMVLYGSNHNYDSGQKSAITICKPTTLDVCFRPEAVIHPARFLVCNIKVRIDHVHPYMVWVHGLWPSPCL
jgi:hypothetical protein